ncbi:ATPase, P-type, calcium-transporting, PMCA-type, partial [Metarhizium majus ARSEF 297]
MDSIAVKPIQRRDNHGPAPDQNARPLAEELREESPIPSNNFAFTPSQLHKLMTFRSLEALDYFGGTRGLAAGLRTDIAAGLSADETNLDGSVSFDEAVAAGREARSPVLQSVHPPSTHHAYHALRLGDGPDPHFADRKRIFGANRLPRRKQKSFFKLMWIAFNDKLLILLTISACISLAIGIYQSVSAEEGMSNIEWVDGVTVVIAIVIIVLASAANDWQKNHKFEKLNERKKHREVTVFRSGRAQLISLQEVNVGDVMHIEAGEVVAVDGVLLQASGLHINESSISGESGMVHKTVPGDHDASHAVLADPFILSGTTVTRGVGRYLVTSVGSNSTYGRTLMSLREDVEETPLQAKLGRLGKQLIVFGAVVGAIFFVILFIRYLVRLKWMASKGPSNKAEEFFHILILSITVVIITVPEGLALNVTVALAFATTRMLRDNNLVRLIRSCEVMGNATCVCSDKTGTLTQNKMTVVAGRIGLDGIFNDMDSPVVGAGQPQPGSAVIGNEGSTKLVSAMSYEVKDLIKDSIALNSTAFEGDDSKVSDYFGSSTETALLKFSRDHLGLGLLTTERANNPVLTMLPFESSRKWMAVLIRLPNGRYRLLVKGAAEIVFEYCAYVLEDHTYQLTTVRLSEDDRTGFRATIQDYASSMLRPVAIAYKDFDESEVFESPDDDPATINLEWLASGLIFIGFFGIRDPLREEVIASVKKCQDAGVFVRMVTGDNFLTAKAVAAECGIYSGGGVAMDGPTFRKLSEAQLDEVIPRLQVLARSSPEDKLLLVTRLRAMKETVAVTGDGTNDALALKAADVGFAMGIQGTEVAKEAASIILLDDNFASIVKSLSWGRTINDAVKKFCQFQFTINITAGTLTIISKLVGDSIFTVVQLLWINLIMDIFASLGLATDLPSPDFLKRKPEPRNAPIITITMWKMILGQAIYQLAVIFTVHYAAWEIFDPHTQSEIEKLQTLVFNIYVWMQFFNQHNCRRVDNKLDIWYQGVLRNPWFIGVQVLTLVGQFVIIFKGGEAFDTVPLTGAQWGWSMLFGILTLPLGALIRQVPDRYVASFFQKVGHFLRWITKPFKGWCSCLSILHIRSREKLDQDPREMASSTKGGKTGGGKSGGEDIAGSKRPISGSTHSEASGHRGHASGAVAESSSEVDEDVDLHVLVEAARLGRSVGKNVLELHPKTLEDDPIIRKRSTFSLPPSQDPAIMQFVSRAHDEESARAPRRRRRARAVWVEPTRPRPVTMPQRPGLTWESFLRSKRR